MWKQRTNQAVFNRIGMKHVDFVVCDASHGTAKAKEYDAFVDQVFAAA